MAELAHTSSHESQLLNFQEFWELVVKCSHYFKFNYINTYILIETSNKYSKLIPLILLFLNFILFYFCTAGSFF